MRYDYQKIGKRVREERIKKDWTQNDVVAKLNNYTSVGRNAYLDLEKGKGQRFPLECFTTLAELFHCSVGYLLCEYDTRFQIASDIGEVLGLSESAVNRLLSEDNSRAFVNFFLEWDKHYRITQTFLNYGRGAKAEKSKTYQNSSIGYDQTAYMFGLRGWAIQEYTHLLDSIYNPESGESNYQPLLEKYEEQKKSLLKYQSENMM